MTADHMDSACCKARAATDGRHGSCDAVHAVGNAAEGEGNAGRRHDHSVNSVDKGSVASDDSAACEQFLDSLEPVCGHVADDLRDRLHRERLRNGPGRADGDWMEGPLHVWLNRLDQGMIDLDGAMLPLAVGINEVLSMRDALILSVVGGDAMRDQRMLMDIVRTPHDRHVVTAVHQALSNGFDDRDGPDRARCRTAVLMLAAMAKVMPERMKVQPLAIISYILWWTGDGRAEAYALSCLSIDEGCSLAAIVLKSVRNGLYPACCGG